MELQGNSADTVHQLRYCVFQHGHSHHTRKEDQIQHINIHVHGGHTQKVQ